MDLVTHITDRAMHHFRHVSGGEKRRVKAAEFFRWIIASHSERIINVVMVENDYHDRQPTPADP